MMQHLTLIGFIVALERNMHGWDRRPFVMHAKQSVLEPRRLWEHVILIGRY
jgi:hypothetical protein